jgi:hypothetical protein
VQAHGFGQHYDLPVPLQLYLIGAAATVVLSFILFGLFIREIPVWDSYPRLNLLRWPWGRFLVHPRAFLFYKLLGMGLFVLVVASGFLGRQYPPSKNLAPTFVWVIWWVGLAYVSALVGNLWPFINPWRTAFAGLEAFYRRLNPQGKLSLQLPYPQKLGVWPGFLLFFMFAWVELVFKGRAVPANLALILVLYSLLTWIGMFLFGREQWLQCGEFFSLVFGLLAHFALTEIRVIDPKICKICGLKCRNYHGECLNCHGCFELADNTQREWNLRPFAVGLLHQKVISTSMMALVLLLLSTVTFDGFMSTSLWIQIRDSLYWYAIPNIGIYRLTLTETLGMITFIILFLGLYWLSCKFMAIILEDRLPTEKLARAFTLSLIPIAIAYHLAHYLSFLLIQGQLVIPLASDPFGLGWNLLGTAGYKINIGIIGARFVWITAVIAIVLGHVMAICLSHIEALKLFKERSQALRSQYPMLILMVGYTMVSLWIFAQPIVEGK